ncbi:MAG TPA: hypothetical protein VIG48_03690 [Jatrophihabitans sp.]
MNTHSSKQYGAPGNDQSVNRFKFDLRPLGNIDNALDPAFDVTDLVDERLFADRKFNRLLAILSDRLGFPVALKMSLVPLSELDADGADR